MVNVQTILDVVVQVLTVAIAIGGCVAFVFRKWISASIESHFKRQIALELEGFRHSLSRELEQERARLTKDLEAYKRALDSELRVTTRVSDRRIQAYETFYSAFGRVLVHLQMLKSLDKSMPSMDNAVRDRYRLQTFELAGKANEDLGTCNHYMDPDISVRIATLYRDLNEYVANGAQDKSTLDKLTTETAFIGAEMRSRLGAL